MMPNTNTSAPGRTRRRKTLPKLRSSLSQILIYFVGLFFFIVSLATSKTDLPYTDVIFVLISVLIPLLFLLELVFRTLYIAEEYHHLVTRYENSYWTLFKDTFYFSPTIGFIFIVSLFTCLFMYMKHGEVPHRLWYDLGVVSLTSSLLSALVLQRNANLKCGPLYNSLWIENSNGLDYGSGMAHSFFHGYLKLIIPKTGTKEKHLEEVMKDYEDTHGVKLVFHKLFILIPKSLYCPVSLKNDEISPSIEESTSLEEKVMTVAGVQNRVYKNSVYKIKSDDGRKVYVCAEYATPLKTFKDVVNFNGEHSKYYQKHKNEIVLHFYLTLQKVLKEHENCTDFCELIFYDDKNENDKYKDVGQILLQRIRKLQRSR
jgi:hypothetical protein